MPKFKLSVSGTLENREASTRCCVQDPVLQSRRTVVHHNQIKLCRIPPANVDGRHNENYSKENQDPGLATSTPVVVDESCGDSREVAVGDETESLVADTMAGTLAGTVGKPEVEDPVSSGAEKVTGKEATPRDYRWKWYYQKWHPTNNAEW